MPKRLNRSELNKDRKKKRLIVILICIVIVLALTVTVLALVLPGKEEKPVDYEPIQTDQNAMQFEDDVTGDGKIEHPEGGGGVALTYSDVVSIDLETGMAKLNFRNPAISDQDLVLDIVMNDKVIAGSGRIEPGYLIAELAVDDISSLEPGEYEGRFDLEFYNSETNEKAILNTVIPITITVK